MFAQLSLPFGVFQSLDALVRAASEAPVLDPEDERRLSRAARGGDGSARETLLRAHARIVVDEAIRYRDANRDASQLVPRGLEALEAAVDRFDPEAHGRLSAYIREWVRMEIRRDGMHA